ncbi:carboxymuconolactone decarboxylase family protein [Ligilactobacillus saerimneri]|uniref:carboxymuconolactone decarboxylase family protein n=1 Tax=Ligilactobacillus saerimneri TaxID=228229 RepID=UPI002943D737|nr:carboxymuconolactone decarboxylase family protein [Ligilactobacillus saerimneri]
MTVRQTVGHEQLDDFAPQFAHFNDDVLFGEVWADEESLSARDRSLLTVTALITKGAFAQLPYHLQTAKKNGISKQEISAVITQLAFYVGWPNAWSAFNLAKQVWSEK